MITPEQREARRYSIGASDTPSILGLTTYAGPYSVWLEKTDGWQPGRSDDESRRLDWGNDLELAVVSRARKDLGVEIKASPETVRLQRGDVPLHANLDGLLLAMPAEVADGFVSPADHSHVGVLEVKSGEPQGWHVIQVQHQLAVAGCTWGLIAHTQHGRPPTYLLVTRDDQLWNHSIMRRLRTFWRCVESEQPPEATWADTVAVGCEAARDTEVELPAGAQAWVENAVSYGARQRAAKRLADEAKNRIRVAMGPATIGRLPDGRRVTWKPDCNGDRRLLLPRR